MSQEIYGPMGEIFELGSPLDVSADGGYGEDWDQRDHLDEYADEHLPLGEPEPEPVA